MIGKGIVTPLVIADYVYVWQEVEFIVEAVSFHALFCLNPTWPVPIPFA